MSLKDFEDFAENVNGYLSNVTLEGLQEVLSHYEVIRSQEDIDLINWFIEKKIKELSN